jgi:formylglycine-generating enzyme
MRKRDVRLSVVKHNVFQAYAQGLKSDTETQRKVRQGMWNRVAASFLFSLVLGCSSVPSTPLKNVCKPLATGDMRWIPPGRFNLGEGARYAEEGPPRVVNVKGFWMDTHELTNAEFADFIKATGYKTLAERTPPLTADAPPEMRLPGSAVFHAPTPDDSRWWRWAVGAQWRHPSGPNDRIIGKEMMPVVQITYDDAAAYASWAGKQLPTEAQWEYAARAGKKLPPEPVDASGTPTANYYQGVFPIRDLGEDGYRGRAPVGCFPPNQFGLYDMIGNVWEWTRDADGRQPQMPVIKGGSFLCAKNYCARYRPAARQFQERGLGTDHIGVRFVR